MGIIGSTILTAAVEINSTGHIIAVSFAFFWGYAIVYLLPRFNKSSDIGTVGIRVYVWKPKFAERSDKVEDKITSIISTYRPENVGHASIEVNVENELAEYGENGKYISWWPNQKGTAAKKYKWW